MVASTEGLAFRIHRATREPADGTGQGFIMDERHDYPLRFEYHVFSRVLKDNFDREIVLKTFENILLGYGANELRLLLYNAAKAIMAKLGDPEGKHQKVLRQNEDFYRYGLTLIPPGSRNETPAASRVPSETNISVDMLRSGATTPGQSGALTAVKSAHPASKKARD